MKFAVDRIEENIVVLENLETKEIKNVPLSSFKEEIHDGMIVEYQNGEYINNQKSEEERVNIISEKFNNLKNKNS